MLAEVPDPGHAPEVFGALSAAGPEKSGHRHIQEEPGSRAFVPLVACFKRSWKEAAWRTGRPDLGTNERGMF